MKKKESEVSGQGEDRIEETFDATQSFQPKPAAMDTSIDDVQSTFDVTFTWDSSSEDEINRIEPDDFEILSELGRGGMGVVNKCHQKSLDRIVAIKSILNSSFPDEEQLARFLDEARAVAKLKHENIVSIHQVSKSTSNPFYVMEYVEGTSLDHLIREWTLDQNRAVRIMAQITSAIEEAHSHKIVHRDLKPANVLVAAEDKIRVTDFGLAKFLGDDTSKTMDGQVLGTPSYMAPEQARGESSLVDEKTDLYAIGATLYACLTGSAPFRAGGISETLQMVQHADPIPPRRINPKISRDLETICLKCLEKDPKNRYQNARELGEEFNRFLNDEPIQARPVSAANKLYRKMRKKPFQSSLIVATLVLGIVLSMVIPWMIIGERNRIEGLKNQMALSIANGDWQNGLSVAAELSSENREDETLLFQRFRCLAAQGKRSHIAAELEELTNRKDLGEKSSLQLWKGENLIIAGKEAKGIECIKSAIAGQVLPPAENEYAKALIASRSSEAIDHLSKVISLDPAHHRAHCLLFSTLLYKGRLEKADYQIDMSLAKFPDDPKFWAMKMIAQAVLGKSDGVAKPRAKAIELGGESITPILDALLKQYSMWATVMNQWESVGSNNQFIRLVDKRLNFEKLYDDSKTMTDWQFDQSFLRLPLGWKKKQNELERTLYLISLRQYKWAADLFANQIDDETNGEILFMIGQALYLAENYVEAAKVFEEACERPSRFKNTAREANWVAAMSYAELWLRSKKEDRKLINQSAIYASRHIEFEPAHEWHEGTLCKIACNDFNYVLAKRYLDRVRKFAPKSKEIPALEARVSSVAFAPIENRLEEIANQSKKNKEELLKEVEEYHAKMMGQISTKYESTKALLSDK